MMCLRHICYLNYTRSYILLKILYHVTISLQQTHVYIKCSSLCQTSHPFVSEMDLSIFLLELCHL